jgi:hypothetical protein
MGNEGCCKAGRISSEYDLTAPRQFASDLDDYLVAKWTGAAHHGPTGVRPLTRWFNKQMLRAAYRQHDRSGTDVRIDAEYDALRSEDVDAHEREGVVADLEADGLNPESLVDDFISKSTLSRHLNDCLGATKDSSDGAVESNWEHQSVAYAQEAFQSKVEAALRSWENKDRLDGATEAELETPVLLGCPHCPTRVKLKTALERGYVCADHLDPTTIDGDGSQRSDAASAGQRL